MRNSDLTRATLTRKADARSARRRLFRRPILEHLEGRALLANFLVISATDDPHNPDPNSLRGAIIASNAAQGTTNTITFDIPGSGVQTITLAADLPTITVPVVINGYSQPGASPNTLAVGDNAKLLIQLDGTNADNGFDIAAGNSMVEGLVINRVQGDAIQLRTAGNDVIMGNFIGTDPTGTSLSVTVANASVSTQNQGNGISILDPTGDTVGGTAPAARNVISGNKQNGIAIDQNSSNGGGGAGQAAPSNNLLENNYIGTDASGTKNPNPQGPSNGHGIRIARSAGNRIIDNVVSNSEADGMEISFAGTDNNLLQGNMIGTDVTGSVTLGNGANGIFIQNGVTQTTIGGTAAGQANVIAGNGLNGVELIGADFIAAVGEVPTQHNLVEGNLIGTDAAGKALGNGGVGVYISSLNNFVGAMIPQSQNTIAFNKQGGVKIDDGTLPSTGNAILSNKISGNLGPGITTSGQVSGNTLAFNTVQGNTLGIQFANNGQQVSVIYHNAFFSNNAPGANSGIGIFGVNDIANTFIISNAFTGQSAKSMFLVGSGSATPGLVVDGNAFRGGAPMVFVNVSNARISSNVMVGTSGSGIIGVGPMSGLAIVANTVTGATGDGIIFVANADGGLKGSTIASNNLNANHLVGIALVGATGNLLQGNVVTNNHSFGILVLAPSSGNTMMANVVSGNAYFDVDDATVGAFPGGTANAWVNNQIKKPYPAGLH